MKKISFFLMYIIFSLLASNVVVASDNTFIGTETVEELYEDLDIIIEESHASYQDGEISLEELNFSRTHKIFIDTLPYIFNEKTVTADTLKELLNNSDYVYYMPIYREHETVFLTIAKGLEITESDYELFEKVSASEEEIARLERDVGRWNVTERGVTDEPRDPSMDYIGLMESYLDYKNIHNAEIYYVGMIHPRSLVTAVVFTGKKTESGEDEILFVAVDALKYDGSGNLISVDPYIYEDDGDFEIEDAEYTYEELRELSKEFDLDPGTAGGGGLVKKRNYGVYAALIAGVVVIAIGITLITKKKLKR